MRSLRRVLAGVLVAATMLILPMAGTSAAVTLADCYAGGGHMGVGNGYTYCDGGIHNGQIIGAT